MSVPSSMPAAGGASLPSTTELHGLGRCLVTGANGFIGRALLRRLLDAGLPVVALCRSPPVSTQSSALSCIQIELGHGQLRSEQLQGVDSVFHLAAHTHALDEFDDEQRYMRTNVDGTRELLQAARAAGCARLVLVSSVKAMGEHSPLRLDETAPARPLTAYGRSKRFAEQLLLESAGDELATSIVRLPLVYGPGVKGNLQALLDSLAKARMPALPTLSNRRSMVHVDDVVQGLLLAALRSPPGEIYLLTDGHDYSSSEIEQLCRQALRAQPGHTWRRSLLARLALPGFSLRLLGWGGDLLGRIRGRRAPFDSARLAKLLESASYDDRKARERLGYRPTHSLRSALPEMVQALAESGPASGSAAGSRVRDMPPRRA